MDDLILIVDDAKFARTLVRNALRNGGFENTVEASTAAQAKEIFTERKPVLTILDITLPDNSDLTLLQELLAIAPKAKIVMASAIGQNLIIADALEMGAADFITKPFVESEFLGVVNAVLAKQ